MRLPKRFPNRDDIAAVRAEAERLEPGGEADDERRLAGRVMGRREMGKLAFLDLVDRSGRIQLLCDTSRTGPIEVDLGDIVGVTGSPARAKRGEPSIAVDELELLAKIQRPLPDTFHGVTDVETRYRQRHLDLLMNEETRADFELRTRIVAAVRRHLDDQGFLEVETPVLQPRYGGGFAEPFVTHYNALEEQGLWTRDPDELRSRLNERGVDTSHDTSWAQLVDHALSHFVEPALIEPTFLHDYPVELSPFARTTDEDPAIVERFEYFVGGTELGNAFSELNDPGEQAARFEQQAAEAGGEPGDPDYVEALAYGMPPTGGVGLGIDRLTMVLAGRDNIRDVVLFPALRERS